MLYSNDSFLLGQTGIPLDFSEPHSGGDGSGDGRGRDGSCFNFGKVDDFRLWLSTRCCTCLSFVPSLALVLIAAVLITLLVATIPLAFALIYSSPQATESAVQTSSIGNGDKFNFFVDRDHSSWPELTEVLKYQDWEDHTSLRTTELLPKNISSCTIYGFACTAQPHIVVSQNRRCDGNPDCEDASDEIDCQGTDCSVGEYRCKDIDMCIPTEAVCDGENHCPFGDDEQNCKECSGGAKICGDEKEGICLAKRFLCDGFVDCHFDGSDEKECDCASCSGQFSALCNGTNKMCISKISVCDGRFDCPDGEDEVGCPGVCPLPKLLSSLKDEEVNNTNHILCSDGHFHDRTQACDGLLEACRFSCEKCNPASAFQCSGVDSMSQECIHRSLVCDGKSDCLDGSDELDCNCKSHGMNECNQHTKTKLPFRRCYSNSNKCDGYSDCMGGEDERKCSSCASGAFLCRSEGRCVPPMARCNGETDCLDESDEMNCTCKECSRHSKQMYMCEAAQRCYPLNKVCTPYSVCTNATRMDKMFCAIRGHEYF
uniref:Atrial natriuretic peptide-converting enzyme n=1 Tax=Meloidogyne hapla TaxID=6305 RepID=A0A1I8B1D7_MELHA